VLIAQSTLFKQARNRSSWPEQHAILSVQDLGPHNTTLQVTGPRLLARSRWIVVTIRLICTITSSDHWISTYDQKSVFLSVASLVSLEECRRMCVMYTRTYNKLSQQRTQVRIHDWPHVFSKYVLWDFNNPLALSPYRWNSTKICFFAFIYTVLHCVKFTFYWPTNAPYRI
jgi:hypothetical protein